MSDDLARIRAELTPPPMSEGARDALWERVRLEPVAERVRRSSRWGLPTRTLFATAAIVLLVGGAALASGTGVLDRVFGDDAPAPDRVGAFREPARHPVSADEYARLRSMVMAPPKGLPVGTYPDSVLEPLFELAPIERARVLVDDEEVGRIVAVPTTDGKLICKVYTAPDGTAGSSGGCGSQFDAAGLMAEFGFSRPPGSNVETFVMQGIAADDVERIVVEFADGRTEDVPLRSSAFRWTGTSEDERPVDLRSYRRGAWHSAGRANQFLKETDPYLQP